MRHLPRGTWYAGSAGCVYRLVRESLPGLEPKVDRLRFAPCRPPAWNEFASCYRYRETYYDATVRRTQVESDAEPGAARRC